MVVARIWSLDPGDVLEPSAPTALVAAVDVPHDCPASGAVRLLTRLERVDREAHDQSIGCERRHARARRPCACWRLDSSAS